MITYRFLKNPQTISLNKIQFFKKEEDLVKYIEKNNLDLVKRTNSIEFEIIKNLVDLIKAYLSGKKLSLYQNIKDLGIDISIEKKFPTPFSQKVIKYLINNVNYGEITTYSDIGKKINTRAYRAIGNVMKNNPIPLIIPCHRVIRKNGTLGGFMGETDDNWQKNIKLDLLKIEGITQNQLKTSF